MKLYLREAKMEDVKLLFDWANDNEVRKNSFNSEPIPYENHVKWFQKIMADDNIFQFIMCDNEQPVGQIRLNMEGCKAYIGYSIAPQKRGMGLGEKMLRLILENHPATIKTFIGQVKYENPASAKVFEKCGFTKKDTGEFLEYWRDSFM